MKRVLFCFALAMMTLCAGAVPAKRGLTKVLTLTDGTTVTAQLVGDEHGHYWMTADGKAYQSVGTSDVFQPVDAHRVMAAAKERRAKANGRRTKRLSQRRVGEVGSYTGQKKGLIILANFASGGTFSSSNNNALYQRIANEQNFSYGKFKGSMYDYFYAQSEGQFELTFDVVGPVTVSKSASYYGSNDSSGNDKYPATMVSEAIKLANSLVNYADYDWDGDGEVDQVYVVYAGKGEADGGAASTIWPHEWKLSEAAYYGDGDGSLRLDGVKIDTYACGPELDGATGTIAGIGTMCHEFSHCLGYPDFYDTDYSGGQGMGEWDLMDSGSYNGDGYQPAGYTSYERWVAGWKEPIELLNSQKVTGMKSLQDGGESYVIYNKGNTNEYFMLENRQKRGWDASLPGAGLLILHVDYDAQIWIDNEPNDNPSHQRMTWIPADNKYDYESYWGEKYYTSEGMAKDTYPYGSNNSFGPTSTPAAKFYNKNSDGTYYMDSWVKEIKQNSDSYKTISFNFVGVDDGVATPEFSPKAGVFTEAQQVTITCKTEGASIYYTIDGSTPTADSTPYTTPISVESTTTIKAIAVLDGEVSEVASARYVISDETSQYFRLVKSVDELVSGTHYVIVNESKAKAAGVLKSTSSAAYLTPVDVTLDTSTDVVTINENVEVFTAEKVGSEWTFVNSEGQYLYATAAKKLAYSDDEHTWSLADDSSAEGVGMTFGSYGTMLYNVSSPRFTTYTSSPNSSMIVAHLYVETDGAVTPVEKQDVAMAFNPTTATASLGASFTEPTLTINPAGLAVTYSSSAPSVASVDAATGKLTINAVGTTVITASFAGNDQYNAASASYTLTVVKPEQGGEGKGRYQLVTSADQLEAGKNYLVVGYSKNGYVAYNGFDTNKGLEAPVVPVDDIIDLTLAGNTAKPLVLETGNYQTTWAFYDNDEGAYIGTTSSESGTRKAYLATSTKLSDYYRWTIDIASGNVAQVKNFGKNYYLKYNDTSNMFRVYATGQQDIYLYKEIMEVEEPETIEVTVGETGYATLYYGEKNLTVPADIEARTYSVAGEALTVGLTYAEGDVIPAGTGVVLKAEAATYVFTVTEETGDVDPNNMLRGSDVDAMTVADATSAGSADAYFYRLVAPEDKDEVGFYWANENGAAFESKAHKAYLVVPVEVAKQVKVFLLDPKETTGIERVVTAEDLANQPVFDLMGRRMNGTHLPKGIYIVGGKKVVIR